MKAGGAGRFMVILKQTKTLWIASRASCQESEYQPIRGKWMKEGKVWDGVQASLLLCLHQLNSPIFHSDYTLPTAVLPALTHRKVRLESFALFEVSVRDTGSNRRKKLISPCPIPSLALFVPLPLKSFVFEFVTQIIFSRRTKATKRTTTLHKSEINHFFFSCLSKNKQEKLHLLLMNCENCKEAR